MSALKTGTFTCANGLYLNDLFNSQNCTKSGVIFAYHFMKSQSELYDKISNNLRAGFMRTKTGQKGFTLIEVVIVVAIIGILAAVAVPNFLSWLPNMRLKAATRDLYGSMMRAKMEAIKSNTPSSFNFTSGTGSPCTGGTYTFTNSAGTIVNTSMINDICLSTTSSFPGGFSTKGTALGATGSIILTHPQSSKTYTITQTIAGGVKIQ